LAVAAVAVLIVQLPAATQSDTVSRAIERYARGDFDGALAGAPDFRLLVSDLTAALDQWIAAGEPSARPARTRTAVLFSLEFIWKSTRSWVNTTKTNLDPRGRVVPGDAAHVRVWSFVAQGLVGRWCAERLATSGPADAFERLDWLATIGVMEDGHAWHDVLDVATAGLARVPGEPRLRLAQVLARTNIDLGSLRVSDTVRADLLTDENLPSSVTNRIPKAIQQLDVLLNVPAVAGELQLRAGYLELRRRKWQPALDRLDRARELLQEPALIATADYFDGWIHERLKEPALAIAAYRRAHARTPLVRNLSTSLAALLFVGHERDEAYAILDRALNAPEPPDDLLFALEHGDARYLPALIREARGLVR
jgi:hypothetical protein